MLHLGLVAQQAADNNNMKISELKVGQGKADIEAVVKQVGDTRSFNKFGRELKVANAIIEDDSGSIKLTLWNDEIMKVKTGDKIKITNGFVNEFNSEKQLTAGKFGKLEVLDKDGKSTASDKPVEEVQDY